MTMLFIRLSVALTLLIATRGWAQHTGHTSPYQNETDRAIKTLSAEEVSGYLNGRGMGLAKAAELNGYPGPMHILEAEKDLKLTPDQKALIQATFEVMHNQAVELGKQIVQQETALNGLFSNEKATPETVQTTVDSLARLQGLLRLAHLDAHLKTKKLLSNQQIKQYNQVRGYTK